MPGLCDMLLTIFDVVDVTRIIKLCTSMTFNQVHSNDTNVYTDSPKYRLCSAFCDMQVLLALEIV